MSALSNLQNWATKNYRLLFILLLISVVATGSLTEKDKYLVVTKAAPKGMLCMELNTDNSRRDNMLAQWDSTYKNVLIYSRDTVKTQKITGINALDTENNADYLFIPCYVCLLLLFFLRLGKPVVIIDSKGKKTITPFSPALVWTFVILTFVAGLMDVVEDIGITRILHQHLSGAPLSDAATVGYPSHIKWALIGIILITLSIQAIRLKKIPLWLAEISSNLKTLLGLLWQFRIVLITLLVFFAILYVSDQGQDLLLTVNSSGWGCLWFMLSTTVIAMLCWHLPKAIDNAANLKYGEFWLGPVDFDLTKIEKNAQPKGKLDLARLFGAAGFLVPACGILQTMQSYHISYKLSIIPPMPLLALLIILYTIALQKDWIEKIYDKGNKIWAYRITMLLMLAAIIGFEWGLGHKRDPIDLAYLSVDLILLSLMFLITISLRRSFKSVKDWKAAPWITFSALISGLLFIACNWPSFLHQLIQGSRFYTIPIVFCAVAGYLLFFAWLLFVGKKTGIHFVSLLLLITITISTGHISTYHNIAIKTNLGYQKSMDSLDNYARGWLLNRETEISEYPAKHGVPYPVYFVNAHGGGVRATIWTTMVIGTLDSVLRNQYHDSQGFQHYAFSYSGASGGTVGLSLLCGSKAPYQCFPGDDNSLYPNPSRQLYSKDNLTLDIVALLGRDMLMYSIGWNPLGIADRARLMEQDWEQDAGEHAIYLNKGLGEIWKKGQYQIPLFFSNTYDIHTGNKGIVAPVLLDTMDFPSAIFLAQEIKSNQDIRLSTAAFLSARFPYVSPTGKLQMYHFTDGGTIENSGGETSLQVMRVFKRVLDTLARTHPGLKNVSLNILAIPNSVAGIESPEQEKNLYEPVGPPAGILQLREANDKRAELINSRLKSKPYSYTSFSPQLQSDSGIWPVLPLGWQVSDFALKSMAQSAKKTHSALDTVYYQFGLLKRKH